MKKETTKEANSSCWFFMPHSNCLRNCSLQKDLCSQLLIFWGFPCYVFIETRNDVNDFNFTLTLDCLFIFWFSDYTLSTRLFTHLVLYKNYSKFHTIGMTGGKQLLQHFLQLLGLNVQCSLFTCSLNPMCEQVWRISTTKSWYIHPSFTYIPSWEWWLLNVAL